MLPLTDLKKSWIRKIFQQNRRLKDTDLMLDMLNSQDIL